jgi:hypothetical protein
MIFGKKTHLLNTDSYLNFMFYENNAVFFPFLCFHILINISKNS